MPGGTRWPGSEPARGPLAACKFSSFHCFSCPYLFMVLREPFCPGLARQDRCPGSQPRARQSEAGQEGRRAGPAPSPGLIRARPLLRPAPRAGPRAVTMLKPFTIRRLQLLEIRISITAEEIFRIPTSQWIIGTPLAEGDARDERYASSRARCIRPCMGDAAAALSTRGCALEREEREARGGPLS